MVFWKIPGYFGVFPCPGAQILKDKILVKILQILETAAAGGNCCCCLVVIWNLFIVSVLSPGWGGGCDRAAAAGISKTDPCDKSESLRWTLIAQSSHFARTLGNAGPPGDLRSRLHSALLCILTYTHAHTYLLTHSPCVCCSVSTAACSPSPRILRDRLFGPSS